MAKRSSGATEINGFIAVGNDKSGNVKKTSVRNGNQTKPTLSSKEDSRVKKPVNNVEKNVNTKTISGGGQVRTLAAQNDLEKKKTLVNKKPAEIKPTIKREAQPTNNKIYIKKDAQPKTNTINKNVVRNAARSIPSEQIEQRKLTNIKTLAEKPLRTKVEPKKAVDVKQVAKSRIHVGKDAEQKKTTRAPIITSQNVKSNNISNVSKTKGIVQNVKASKPKTPKDSSKENETSRLPEMSRQGTWVKEASNELQDEKQLAQIQKVIGSNERNAVDVENYESDFEAETSLSERTDLTVNSLNSDKIKARTNVLNNRSRKVSSRKQEIDKHADVETAASINSNKTLEVKRQKMDLANVIQTSQPSVSSENSVLTENKEFKDSDKPDKIAGDMKYSSDSKKNDEQSTTLEANEQFYDNDNYGYEDDFEEYESDFEEDTESGLSITSTEETGTVSDNVRSQSTNEDVNASANKFGTKVAVEEERKLDSGNYDLTTKMVLSEAVKQRQMDEIREAISRENSIYQESKTNETEPESLKDESNKIKIMNFKEAYNRSEIKKSRVKAKQRASQLLGMVTLHAMQYTLFEMTPIPYSVFIKCYGKLNTVQASTQTNEDVLHEEVQTDVIVLENKWTQYPIEFHRWENNGDDLNIYLEDRAGVGSDTPNNHTKCLSSRKYNANRLSNFMQYAGQIMLILLEEEEQISNLTLQETNKRIYKFSDGLVQISVENINFLKDRTISDIVFSPHNPNTILTVHRIAKENGNTFIDQYYARSIICVWNILEPSQPLKMLVAPCQISAACFDDTFLDLIYAGLTDGTVCVWDLSESIDIHKQNMIVDMPILRSPSYCTYDINEEIHMSTIIALTSIGTGLVAVKGKRASTLVPAKLISLSEDGKIIVWTVIHLSEQPILSEKQALSELGVAFWAKVKLQFTSILDPMRYLHVNKDMCWAIQFICMVRSPVESPSLLLGSNIGKIVHMRTSGVASEPESVYASSSGWI